MPVGSVPGYRLVESIHKTSECEVVRAVRERDGLPAVLKVMALEVPTPRDIIRYR